MFKSSLVGCKSPVVGVCVTL